MFTSERKSLAALWLLILSGAGIGLLKFGFYGWSLFVIAPFVLGALAVSLVRPTNTLKAAAVGACSVSLACALLLLFALDGAICILMTLPIVVPIASLGAVLAFRTQQSSLRTHSGAVLLVLPIAAFTWDVTARPPVFHVTTQIVVHATPEQVWKHVVSFPRLPETRDWVFHTGVAFPIEARIDGTGVGSVRYCQFSTGAFVEPITIWDEPHLLRFRVTQNPSPLQEWSPGGQIHPAHLHGYLISEGGQFELTPLAGGSTLLAGTTWYRHSLWPAQYWRAWSDAIIHRIHLRVLNHVRTLAEQDRGN